MPLARLRFYRERARQKRKAIQMLALSGVIRPSHVELRYGYHDSVARGGTARPTPHLRSSVDAWPSLVLPSKKAIHPALPARGKGWLHWLRQGLTIPL